MANRITRDLKEICILSVLVVVATLFIFTNSIMDYESSHGISGNVADIIIDTEESKEVWELFIRKSAHMIEYAVLGVAMITLVKQVEKDFGKKYYSMTLFYVLSVAVIDEHIQSFSDRTSSTSDILLDFTGAVIGILAALGAMWIVKRIRRIKKGE